MIDTYRVRNQWKQYNRRRAKRGIKPVSYEEYSKNIYKPVCKRTPEERKERNREAQRKYYYTHKEICRERHKRYYHENEEYRKKKFARKKNYEKENREHINEMSRKRWAKLKKENPEKYKALLEKSKVYKNNLYHSMTEEEKYAFNKERYNKIKETFNLKSEEEKSNIRERNRLVRNNYRYMHPEKAYQWYVNRRKVLGKPVNISKEEYVEHFFERIYYHFHPQKSNLTEEDISFLLEENPFSIKLSDTEQSRRRCVYLKLKKEQPNHPIFSQRFLNKITSLSFEDVQFIFEGEFFPKKIHKSEQTRRRRVLNKFEKYLNTIKTPSTPDEIITLAMALFMK